MSIYEIILWWILAGFVADLILHAFVTMSFRRSMSEFLVKHNQSQDPFLSDYLDGFKVTPWWAHLMVFAVPISIVLHPDISGES